MYFFGATNVYLVNKIQSDNARKKCNGFDFKSTPRGREAAHISRHALEINNKHEQEEFEYHKRIQLHLSTVNDCIEVKAGL